MKKDNNISKQKDIEQLQDDELKEVSVGVITNKVDILRQASVNQELNLLLQTADLSLETSINSGSKNVIRSKRNKKLNKNTYRGK